MHTYDIKQVHE